MDANQIHSCQATAQSGGMVTSLLPEEKASPKGKELDLEGAPTGRRRVMSADLDVYESNAPENGIGGTMFLLLNTMIGSGILNQAQVFSEAGVIGTLLLYVAGGYTIHLGLELLIKAGVRSARLGFTELAHHAYGRRGDLLTDWTVILCNFGGLLSYFTVVGGQTCDILKDLVGASDGDSRWYTQEYAVLPVVVALAILPLCLTRRFGHFVYVSYLSISAIAAVVLCVLIAGPSEGKQYRSEPILWISVPGMAQKFGSVVFAIACAYAAFHAFVSLRPELQTVGQWDRVSSLAIVVGTLMCAVTGLAGYLCFRSSTSGDILDNFQGPNFYFFKVLLVTHLILYIPLDFVVMRHSFCKVLGTDAIELPTGRYVVVTVGLLTFSLGVVMVLYYAGVSEGDAFGYILDLTGGVGNAMLGFVLPGIFYARLNKDPGDPLLARARGLAGWGVCVMAAVSAATAAAWWSSSGSSE
uniref:Amino acid transporter transmembrane domain-containing protein n=1 Tax=Heterosigma akashiwo TaxID=2829 RepID=A0A6V2Y555_HETAK